MKQYQQSDLDDIFDRAAKQEEAGHLRSAFRLLLTAAKAGDCGAQLNLGNFYSGGTGVKPNRMRALYWYRRAYRQGYGPAASNIGVIFRDEKNMTRFLLWFERAAKLKDADANLEIAKIYIQKGDLAKAIHDLEQTCKAKPDRVTEASREEAQQLLKELLPKR